MTGDYSSLNGIIRRISLEEGFEETAEITFGKATEKGDGYSGLHILANVKDDDLELRLFVKKTNDEIIQTPFGKFILQAFGTEDRFYTEVVPTLLKFQSEKNVDEPFDNVPKCYKTERTKNSHVIVLEDLRTTWYKTHDRRLPMDDHHILLAFKAFARFHAITYALKDQRRDDFVELRKKLPRPDAATWNESGFDKAISLSCDNFISNVRKYTDFYFQSRCKIVKNMILDCMDNLYLSDTEKPYETITQGDCWCNNIMFQYLPHGDGKPNDIRLIDFQLAIANSPVFDLSYFFFAAADKKAIDKLDYYLNYYYHHLAKRIRELGSDPSVMYPREVFRQDWKNYSIYGLAMALMVLKVMLMSGDEVLDLKNLKSFGEDVSNAKLKKEDDYIKRLIPIFEYFINVGFS